MTQAPRSFSAAVILVLVNALIWLGFAIIVTTGLHPAIPDSGLVRGVMGILAFLTSGALLILSILLRRRNTIAFYITLALLLIISVFTVTDEFGIYDLIVLIITLIPLVLIIKNRTWCLSRETQLTHRE